MTATRISRRVNAPRDPREGGADGGTAILAVHDPLPLGLSPADNEAGWRSSLAKLAALVEAES
jgi:hypothetical protein